MPGFKVIPDPHPSDRESQASRGENWFPNDCDIAGYLHELFYPHGEGSEEAQAHAKAFAEAIQNYLTKRAQEK